jgi:hypothetical protein
LETVVAESFLAGLAVGIVLGLLIARLRPSGYSSPVGPGSGLVPGAKSHSDSRGPRRLLGFSIQPKLTVRRIETKLTPDGTTITVDGKEFHRLEDIPDPAVAEEVREFLTKTTDAVKDPAMRAELEKELHDAGIEPEGR